MIKSPGPSLVFYLEPYLRCILRLGLVTARLLPAELILNILLFEGAGLPKAAGVGLPKAVGAAGLENAPGAGLPKGTAGAAAEPKAGAAGEAVDAGKLNSIL